MSEPGVSNMRSDEPDPFAGQAERTSAGGCGKPAWIGCGVLVILLGILAIVFIVKAKDILRWSLRTVETKIMSNLPEGTTAAEKQRLSAAFDGAIKAATEGKVNPTDLGDMQSAIMHATESTKTGMTHQDVEDLTTALEKVAGIKPPAPSTPGPENKEKLAPPPQGPAAKPDSSPQRKAPGSLAA